MNFIIFIDRYFIISPSRTVESKVGRSIITASAERDTPNARLLCKWYGYTGGLGDEQKKELRARLGVEMTHSDSLSFLSNYGTNQKPITGIITLLLSHTKNQTGQILMSDGKHMFWGINKT